MERSSTDLKTATLAYIDAVGRKDFEAVGDMLHPDLHFALGETIRHDKAGYVEALERLGHIIDHNEVLQTWVDGNDVCVIYDFVTDTPVGPVRSVEWLTYTDGLIRGVRLVFERERWPEVQEEMVRRMAVIS